MLGTILVTRNESNLEASLGDEGIPPHRADEIADALSEAGGGSSSSFAERAGPKAQDIFETVQKDFAESTGTVFYVMAGIMAVAFLVALVAMPAGKAEAPPPV